MHFFLFWFFVGMVLLVNKLSHFLKNHSKLDTHHHRNPDDAAAAAADYEAALGEFRSGVSSLLNQILLKSSEPPGSEFWTLGRVESCLEGLCLIHKAFVKTVAALNHPLCLWGPGITEEYLSYSFDLLGLLNCVSSCISHLNQARLSLSHGLSLSQSSSPAAAAKHLRTIPPQELQKDIKVAEINQVACCQEISDNKERVIHQSLLIMKRVSFLILGAVLSGLCSDLKPFMELRKSVLGSDQEPLLLRLDSVFIKEVADKQQKTVEVKEINEAAARLAAAMGGDDNGESAAKELGKNLQNFEEKLEGMRKQTDHLFTEVLAARNGLVDGLRCSSSSSKVN